MEAKNPFDCAKRGDVDFFKTVAPEILHEVRDELDNTVLTVAAIKGHLDCCKVIVGRCKQLLYLQDRRRKWSVLHWVVRYEGINRENIMRFLITADSKPDLELGGGAKIPNSSLLTMQSKWGSTALHLAVKFGNNGATQLLLQADRDFELLRMVDNMGKTCLHVAVEFRNLGATKLLLEADRDFELLRMLDNKGKTCLHITAEKGDHWVTRLLLKADRDFELLRMVDHKGRTCLHWATWKDDSAIVQLLLEADHSNDLLAMVDSNQQTALHVAVRKGTLQMVKLICDADPDKQLVSMLDSQGNTPLRLALRDLKVEIVKLLTQVVDMEAKDAIAYANIGYVDFFKTVDPEILLKARDERDRCVLTVAAVEGHLDCCEVIVERCTPLLYHKGGDKWSVLHYVAAFNRDKKVEKIMKFLIIADSKPDWERGGGAKLPNNRLLTMQDSRVYTDLHLAVRGHKHGETKLFLEADRDFELLRMVDNKGKTCLHVAVDVRNHRATKLLLEADRDFKLLRMLDHDGRTCLHWAAEKGDLPAVRMLLEADHSNYLLGVVDLYKRTAVHITVGKGNLDMVKLMCKAGLDKQLLSLLDENGNTPLHVAVRHNNFSIVQMLLEAENSNDLLAVVDTHKRTALHYAVEQGNLDMVKLMCKAGLDKQLLSIPDSQGNTPLHLASRDGRVEIVRLLTEADMEAKLRLQVAISCAKRGDVDFFKTVPLKILLRARDASDFNNVLTVAAKEGHLDCCELIVKRCTPLLYHQDKYKWSVLHDVANSSNNLENIMRFLITADSKPDLELGGGAKIPNKRLLTMQDRTGGTALHLAVRRLKHWATKLLLEADCDFELLRMVDNYGRTCLHIAAEKGDHVLVELILKARPHNEFLKMTERKLNQTALHIAVGNKGHAIAKLLLEADHSNDLLAMVDSHQRTALHYAVEPGNLDMVKLICKAGLDKQLLSMPDSHGNTPLHLVVGNNNLEMARLLIEGDMVIDYCANNSNKTPLLMAMDKAAASDGSGSDSLVICKLLLEKDPSQCTKLTGDKGWTPLHLAASYGLNSVVNDIFRLCPDCINTVDFHGQNVLHIAAYHGHRDVVRQFLESKDTDVAALLNTQDKDGNTPLAVSKGNVEVVRLLLEAHQISAHTANISKQTPYMMTKGKILSDGYGGCPNKGNAFIFPLGS